MDHQTADSISPFRTLRFPPETSVEVRWLRSNGNNLIAASVTPITPAPAATQLELLDGKVHNSANIVDGETGTPHRIDPGALSNSTAAAMWPYQSYKPISWDKYYAHNLQDKHVSITSGLAAGITIGVFFAVFLLTFGCRLYSQRSEGRPRNSSRRRLSVSDLLGWPVTPCQPPPPYEIAIRMPSATPTPTTSPVPPFPGTAAPAYEATCTDTAPAYTPRAVTGSTSTISMASSNASSTTSTTTILTPFQGRTWSSEVITI
uniref:Ig-like domain-containing protein n=1 Tax=Panagrellus redivivus TaxID=6233 RepID=A0A7E4ZZ78_PANRE